MPRYRFEDYANKMKKGDIWARADFAALFGVGRSTAAYHLERAVNSGALNKQYGWCGKQSGWLYGLPATMPRLEGL